MRALMQSLFGDSPSGKEIAIPLAFGIIGIGVAAALALRAGIGLAWWQWLLVAVLAFDIVGGIAANATEATTRRHHDDARPLQPLKFALVHFHPFFAALLLPAFGLLKAALLWLAAIAGTAIVIRTPHALKRALSLGYCGVSIGLFAALLVAPGFEWFAPCFLLKLVAAHAVPQR